MKPATCPWCGAPIEYVRTASGQLLPCDLKLFTVITADGRTVQGREVHHATCPNANQWRKPKDRRQTSGVQS
jgi:hypothetical protein